MPLIKQLFEEVIVMWKKYKKYFYLAIMVVVCIFIGIQIGRSNTEKEGIKYEEEIMMRNIGKELNDVTDYLSSINSNLDVFTYKEYVRLLNEVNDLSVTLDVASDVLYSKNDVAFHLFGNSLDVTMYLFEGVELRDEVISNDFFADNMINEDEQRYITELSKDIKAVQDNYENNKDNNFDANAFEEAFKPFVDKYTIGDELQNLKVDNE